MYDREMEGSTEMDESVSDLAKRIQQMKIKVSHSGVKARVIQQGSFLDQYYLPNADKLMQMIENARLLLYRTPSFFEPQLAHYEFGKGTWYKAQQLYIQPELYELLDRIPIYYEIADIPFYIDTSLTYLGKSSFILTSLLHDGHTGKELAKCELLLVYVDQKLGKSVKIPDEINNKLLPLIQNQPLTFPTVPFPVSRVLTWTIKPTQSEYDANLHVNNSFYTRYFQDCAFYASDQHFYRQLAPPISKHRVLYFYINYIAPSDSSMLLLCQTWEDEIEDKTIYFRLTNSKDGSLIATAILKCGSEVKVRHKHPIANL